MAEAGRNRRLDPALGTAGLDRTAIRSDGRGRPQRVALVALLVASAPVAAWAGGGATSGPVLVLVRHGESRANRAHQFAGSWDVRLTRKGRGQALRAGRLLRGVHIDRAYSSDLKRARDTLHLALEAAGQPGVPTRGTAALNEKSFGVLERMSNDEAYSRYGAARVERWRMSWDQGPPGGENLRDVAGRAGHFIDTAVIPELEAGHSVLVAAHRHTIRALIGRIEGLSQKQVDALEVGNAEPMVLRLDASGRLRRDPRATAALRAAGDLSETPVR